MEKWPNRQELVLASGAKIVSASEELIVKGAHVPWQICESTFGKLEQAVKQRLDGVIKASGIHADLIDLKLFARSRDVVCSSLLEPR